MLLPASIASTCDSGEDIAAAPASSEVDERPNFGMLAGFTAVRTGERQVQPPFRIYHSNRRF